jgi:flavin reductase (DIM6/NTAB) family NADH-FMN oxidoreductase RutF
MSLLSQIRKVVKGLFFGPASIPEYCTLGLRDPQSEVGVWFHGLGAARDVTYSSVVACIRPFTIGIGFEGDCDPPVSNRSRYFLRFHERGGEARLLGEIGLRLKEAIPAGDGRLYLFETRDYNNYCLPRNLLWRRYLHYAYQRWRRSKPSGFRVVARELHALFVFYICPRPVVLVSVVDGHLGNIFPMDLIGPVGAECFTLALQTTSAAVPLMERSRRIALGSVPAEQVAVAYELGKNHRKPCVDWDRLPFATTASSAFGLPVPHFSLRVREMQIENVRNMGSHKLFICRAIEDQRWADGLQLFFMHGFYHAWRERRALL